jgi:hypothetical protein
VLRDLSELAWRLSRRPIGLGPRMPPVGCIRPLAGPDRR